MSIDIGDIGGERADAPSRGDLIFNVEVIIDWLEIHVGDIIGDIPFDQQLETILTNEEVRAVVAERVKEAQAKGRAFPMPSARELAAARERALARRQRG
jgi:hypothetical protein